MLKSYGWGVCRRPCGDVQAAMWWGGGPWDFSVSPSPFGLDFGTLDFGLWDFGLGLDNLHQILVMVVNHLE